VIEIDAELERPGYTLRVSTRWPDAVTGLFGPSGAGKTTLLHLIAGLVKPVRGRIAVSDRVVFDSARGIDVPAHRRNVGVVFQEPRLLPHRTVRQNVLYADRAANVDGLLEALELRDVADRKPAHLSGGQRQRVAIARVLARRPRVLLLDEPMTGLDAQLRRAATALVERVRGESGAAVVWVGHHLDEVLAVTDTLAVIDRGALVGHGRYADLSLDPAVLPHVLAAGLLNVLPMRVERHDPAADFTVLRGGELELRSRLLETGGEVSVAMRAEDVALACGRVEGISIQNQFPAVVRRCAEYRGVIVVELDAGAAKPILAEVSRGSFERLQIAPGRHVTALVKSNALRVLA